MSKLIKGLNEQFNFEISSGYIYLAMSAYLKEQDMDGFAHFMYKQAEEEFDHAKEFYNFLFAIDERPTFEAIEKPQVKFESFTNTFKEALEHEKEVSSRIKKLYEIAMEENNHEAVVFLSGFIKEQVEEEDNFRSIVKRFERINESWNGLYIYDNELGRR
ncbi:MAG: ferritin [Peptoniphilaceae bacterium]